MTSTTGTPVDTLGTLNPTLPPVAQEDVSDETSPSSTPRIALAIFKALQAFFQRQAWRGLVLERTLGAALLLGLLTFALIWAWAHVRGYVPGAVAAILYGLFGGYSSPRKKKGGS